MQPGDENDLIPRGETMKPLRYERIHFKPRVRSALPRLPRRVAAFLKRRSDYADRTELSTTSAPNAIPLLRRACLLDRHRKTSRVSLYSSVRVGAGSLLGRARFSKD